MRAPVVLALAAVALGGARVARTGANALRTSGGITEPFAPSPGAAPFLALGYREAAADLLFVRLRGYFGGYENTSRGIAALCEAIVELDPRFHRVYEYCGGAITLARQGVDQHGYLRAIAILERGAREFPADWRLPNLAGQIYTQDLVTDDPAQRRAWDERGTLLVESAIRKPGAPANAAAWAAVMRTRLGEHERAVQGLREMLLITSETKARAALLAKLAELENDNADAIAGELYEARRRFEREWQGARPTIPATWYVVLGPRLELGFDMTELATGGRDLVTSHARERLEPVK